MSPPCTALPVVPLLAALLAAGGLAACGPSPDGDGGGDGDTVHERREATMEDTTSGRRPGIHEVLARHRDAWMDRPEVVGTGIGRCDEEPCLVIYLRRRTDEAEQALPDSVEGWAVRLEETGRVTPRGGEEE